MKKNNPVLVSGIKSRMRGLRAPILMCVYFLIVLGIFALVYAAAGGVNGAGYYYGGMSRPTPMGQDLTGTLYAVLTVVVFAVIVLMTPAMCAGAIAGERERQTLDLLLCSPLSAVRIVMGKLLANLAFIVFLLVLTLPLFAMVYLFGGMTLFDIAKLFLYLVISAYACASVSTFFSALLKRSSLATILSYVALLLYVVLTLVIGAVMYGRYMAAFDYSTGAMPDYTPFLWRVNPIFAVLELTMGGRAGNMGLLNSLFYVGGMGYSYTSASAPSYNYLISGGFMLGVALLLNVGSAILIKPVKKMSLRS